MMAPRKNDISTLYNNFIEDDDGCWIWQLSLDKDGYGIWTLNSKKVRAHRASYVLHFGPIDDSLVVDHLCRNRCCINPNHLEPVTSAENTMRGESVAAKNALKTHCVNGHLLSGDNLRKRSDGHRDCRTCHNDKRRERRRINARVYASA